MHLALFYFPDIPHCFGFLSSSVTGGEEVSERALMHDLMFVFHGIDGTHVKYDASDDAYLIRPDVSDDVIPEHVQEMLCACFISCISLCRDGSTSSLP